MFLHRHVGAPCGPSGRTRSEVYYAERCHAYSTICSRPVSSFLLCTASFPPSVPRRFSLLADKLCKTTRKGASVYDTRGQISRLTRTSIRVESPPTVRPCSFDIPRTAGGVRSSAHRHQSSTSSPWDNRRGPDLGDSSDKTRIF